MKKTTLRDRVTIPKTEFQLSTERAGLLREAHALLDKADSESRDLTRAERADFQELERRIEAFDKKILEVRGGVPEEHFDGRMTQGGLQLVHDEAGDAAVLTRDQSLAGWVEARGLGRGYGDGFPEQDLSLGRLIVARATGDSRKLTELERRAMAEGTDSAGGYLVPEILASNIIDRARAQSVAFRAGAVLAPMESDTLNIARLATGNVANWKAENAAVTASDEVWERLQLVAKTVVVEQIMSVELREDLSDQALRAIENEIAASIALKIDLAVLEGSGTPPEPLGIAGTTGINSVSMGTNGLKPTSFDHLVNAHFAALKANAPGSSAAVMHPRDAEVLALLKDTTNQPLRRPEAIAGLPFLTSTQIKTDRTQGSSSDASNAYVGDFSEVIVGARPSLQIRFKELTERYADNLQVAFLAWARIDVAVARPAFLTKVIGLRIV